MQSADAANASTSGVAEAENPETLLTPDGQFRIDASEMGCAALPSPLLQQRCSSAVHGTRSGYPYTLRRVPSLRRDGTALDTCQGVGGGDSSADHNWQCN